MRLITEQVTDTRLNCFRKKEITFLYKTWINREHQVKCGRDAFTCQSLTQKVHLAHMSLIMCSNLGHPTTRSECAQVSTLTPNEAACANVKTYSPCQSVSKWWFAQWQYARRVRRIQAKHFEWQLAEYLDASGITGPPLKRNKSLCSISVYPGAPLCALGRGASSFFLRLQLWGLRCIFFIPWMRGIKNYIFKNFERLLGTVMWKNAVIVTCFVKNFWGKQIEENRHWVGRFHLICWSIFAFRRFQLCKKPKR